MHAHIRRRSSLVSAEPEALLTVDHSGEPAKVPAEHIVSLVKVNATPIHPPSNGFNSHHRRESSLHSKKSKRLSLSFPIAPNQISAESLRLTPTSLSNPSYPPTPAESISATSPIDPSGLLVAVAGQERKVLELKEDLAKAESDLKQLKRQWQQLEATRKRVEIRNLAQTQPLQVPMMEGRSSIDSTSTRPSVEFDRKKALLADRPKITKRKVLRGGHARALSLLSPERQTYRCPSPPPSEDGTTSTGLPRSTTMPDTSKGLSRVSSSRANARHSYQGGVTHGAKQLANGMRSGLWTFIEDLRQATVGDEAVHEPTKRPSLDSLKIVKKCSKSSPRGRQLSSHRHSLSLKQSWESLTGANSNLHVDTSGSIWPGAPRTASGTVKMKPMALAPPVDDDDGWSNWDSPAPKSPIRWSGGSLLAHNSTIFSKGLEDDAVKIDNEADRYNSSERDDLTWPAFNEIQSKNLRLTFSDFVDVQERMLTPLADDEPTFKPGSAELVMCPRTPEQGQTSM